MARSAYIYVTRDIRDGKIMAVHTVKHEAYSWFEKHKNWQTDWYVIYRIPDGQGQTAGIPLPIEEYRNKVSPRK